MEIIEYCIVIIDYLPKIDDLDDDHFTQMNFSWYPWK